MIVEYVIFTLLGIISILLCTEHHDHHSHDHTHDPGVSSVSIVCEGSLDLEKVRHRPILNAKCVNFYFPFAFHSFMYMQKVSVGICLLNCYLFRLTCGLVTYYWIGVKTFIG